MVTTGVSRSIWNVSASFLRVFCWGEFSSAAVSARESASFSHSSSFLAPCRIYKWGEKKESQTLPTSTLLQLLLLALRQPQQQQQQPHLLLSSCSFLSSFLLASSAIDVRVGYPTGYHADGEGATFQLLVLLRLFLHGVTLGIHLL